MQHAFSKLAKNDYARYPFLKAAAKYVRVPDLKVDDLTRPELKEVVKRAEERLEEAIEFVRVTRRMENPENEILSYPVAIILAVATKNVFIQKRYALAEAKQAFEDLKSETKERILILVQDFGWKLRENDNSKIPYEFSLSVIDYIRNAAHLRDKKWKLVNRSLSRGQVYLTGNETARLLSEEIRRHVEGRLETRDLPTFPSSIIETVEKIKRLSSQKVGENEMEGFPESVVHEAFPPCIDALYQAFTSGRHLSHIGRFTLTSFLVSIGMPSEKVIELFRNVSDFKERMTRYQVEHIAGEKGSRTKYIPPKCETLKTHGVCMKPNEFCERIHHPLTYYRRKTKISESGPQRLPAR